MTSPTFMTWFMFSEKKTNIGPGFFCYLVIVQPFQHCRSRVLTDSSSNAPKKMAAGISVLSKKIIVVKQKKMTARCSGHLSYNSIAKPCEHYLVILI